MLRLALDGVPSSTIVPLRLITLLGLGTTLFGIACATFAVFAWTTGRVTGPAGWTSLMVIILIFGGAQIPAIGILSEYLGRIFKETKRRPRYVIVSKTGLD